MDECASCAAIYRELAGTLQLLEAPEVPERGEQYGLEVWQRIRARLPEPEAPWWVRWLKWDRLAVAGAVAMLVVAAFIAGRVVVDPGQTAARFPAGRGFNCCRRQVTAGASDGRQRILLTSVTEHLDRSERILTDIMNAPDGGDISTEQRRAGGSRLHQPAVSPGGGRSRGTVGGRRAGGSRAEPARSHPQPVAKSPPPISTTSASASTRRRSSSRCACSATNCGSVSCPRRRPLRTREPSLHKSAEGPMAIHRIAAVSTLVAALAAPLAAQTPDPPPSSGIACYRATGRGPRVRVNVPPMPPMPPFVVEPEALYEQAREAIENSQFDRALAELDRVIAQTNNRADAAMYWKAYSQSKMALSNEALETIKEMSKQFAASPWVKDAKALELEIRQAAGQPISADLQGDEELKLLALRGVMQTDPDKGLPIIEKMLAGGAAPRVRDRALFVLSQSRSPEGARHHARHGEEQCQPRAAAARGPLSRHDGRRRGSRAAPGHLSIELGPLGEARGPELALHAAQREGTRRPRARREGPAAEERHRLEAVGHEGAGSHRLPAGAAQVTSLLLAAALALAQGPPTTITNAQVEARAATQSVEREIASLAARKDDRWVGYRVAAVG